MLECARDVVDPLERVSEPVRREMERKYFVKLETLGPRVFVHLTDNWVEMSLRFIVPPHGVRDVKDELSRLLLDRFDAAHISIASGTYDIVGFPPVKLEGPLVERIARAVDRTPPAA